METSLSGNRICLYQQAQLDQIVDAMARQAEALLANKKRIMVVGILRRGAPLAGMLYIRLMKNSKWSNLTLMNLDIRRYGDDLTLIYPETMLIENPKDSDLDLTGITVLVVDDVFYKGYSMLRAVEYLTKKNATEIRTAVLVDRGANGLPMRVDITGIRLDVAPPDVIEFNVPPYESEFKIVLLKPTLN